MEANHTTATVQALVDAYYNLGALINLYCHSTSPGGGPAGSLPGDYLTYSLSKPRIWSTNSAGIYAWWLQQSNAQVTVNYTNISGQCVTTLSITGEGNTNAAVEILAPSASYSALQVFTNGTLAGTNVYRTNGQVIKVLVGTSVSNAVISYLIPPICPGRCFHCPARLFPGGVSPGCFNQRHGGQWRGQSDRDAGERAGEWFADFESGWFLHLHAHGQFYRRGRFHISSRSAVR